MQVTQLKSLVFVFFLAVTASASANRALKSNKALLGAMSPFEDMIEFALAEKDADISKALATADRQVTGVKKTLPASAASKFANLMDNLHKAASGRDHHKVASNAVEIFRLLSDNLHAAVLDVPKEVSLLDYAGFKLRVLAGTQRPDWQDIRKTVDETAGWWSAIDSEVSDKGLQNAFGASITGLREAAKTKNLAMLRFAAQMDLELVDLLEGNLKPKR